MESSNHGDPTFADRVARAVIDSYNSLPKNGKPAATEWTVLAGIVAARPRNCIPAAGDGGSELGSRSAATQDIEVVALGTGSKCLSGAKLRKDGKVLNDSHAEVLSRFPALSCPNECGSTACQLDLADSDERTPMLFDCLQQAGVHPRPTSAAPRAGTIRGGWSRWRLAAAPAPRMGALTADMQRSGR